MLKPFRPTDTNKSSCVSRSCTIMACTRSHKHMHVFCSIEMSKLYFEMYVFSEKLRSITFCSQCQSRYTCHLTLYETEARKSWQIYRAPTSTLIPACFLSNILLCSLMKLIIAWSKIVPFSRRHSATLVSDLNWCTLDSIGWQKLVAGPEASEKPASAMPDTRKERDILMASWISNA